jgi:fibronectin-binding autotransporter adhesin
MRCCAPAIYPGTNVTCDFARRLPMRLCLLPAVLGAGLIATTPVRAQIFTWQGGGGNNAWNTAANWQGGVAPPSSVTASDVIFGNSAADFPSISPAFSVHSLTFPAGANAFTFDTGPLTLGSGGLNQSAVNSQAFSAPVALGAPQTWTLANGAGGLVLAGGVNTNGFVLTVNAATAGSTANALNGNLTGTGSLTKTGAGTLDLTGANNYSGGTALNTGVLELGSAGALGTAGAITFGGGTLQYSSSNSTDYSARFDTSPNQAYRIDTNGQNVAFATALTSGGGSLSKQGAGTLTLNGVNTFSGPTIISAGTVTLGFGFALANSTVTVDVDGGLNTNGLVGITLGALAGSGSINPGANPATLSVESNNVSTTYSGGLAGLNTSLTKAGSGTLTLSGPNTFGGTLKVDAGAVILAAGGALANDTILIGVNGIPVTFTQTGGTNSAETVVLGKSSADTGTYTLQAGTLSTGTLQVGGGGSGTFNQSGGAAIVTGGLTIGMTFGSNSAVTITGTGSTLTVGQSIVLGGGASLAVNSGAAVTVGVILIPTASGNIVTIDGGTLAASGLSGSGMALFISDPAGGPALTLGAANGTFTSSNSIADALGGPGTVVKLGNGTQTLTGHLTNTGGFNVMGGVLDFSGAVVQLGSGNLTAAAGATIRYDASTRVFGGFLYGPGTHDVTGGATFTGTTAFNSAVINVAGAGSFGSFTNGGTLTVAAGLTSPTVFNGFTNQGSGSITVGAVSVVNVADFQSYGTLTLNPAVVGSGQFTELVNSGMSPLFFNGGSRTFLGTPATAGPPNNPSFVAGVDLHGQNAVVAGGLFVNNGFVVDSTNNGTGTATIIADFGALVKGAGYFQNSIITQNGGKVQAGNSPGSASFGRFVFGPGGVSNYVFAIDDATGTAGPSPDALGHVSGWGLINAVKQSVGLATTSGDFTWTATPTARLTVAIETLVNPTTVGTDVAGPMVDFNSTTAYSWPAAHWAGTYSGPTGVAALEAATSFDTSGFLNPMAGTFGWSLDSTDQTLSLTYTPTAVPEPGAFVLTGMAAIGWVTFWRRRWQSNGPPATLSA